MEFFKKEYPDTGDMAVDVTYVSFGDRPAGHPKGERDDPRTSLRNCWVLPSRSSAAMRLDSASPRSPKFRSTRNG